MVLVGDRIAAAGGGAQALIRRPNPSAAGSNRARDTPGHAKRRERRMTLPPFSRFCVRSSAYASSSRRLRVRFGSTGMPGPVFVETVTFLT